MAPGPGPVGIRAAGLLFLAAVGDASRGTGDVIDLAAANDFLDLARGAASIVHKNALAAGQGAVARLVLQNLRMNRAASQHEQKGRYDRDAKFVHETRMHRESKIFQSAIRTVAQ
jgi:hypothetical protein